MSELSGPEKAAILILSLPEEGARELLSRMDEEEVERILAAVSRIDSVPAELQARVLEEFRERIAGRSGAVFGGAVRTLEIIETLLPPTHAERLRAKYRRDYAPIAWALHPHTPAFIASGIAGEDPQTIALILSQLPTRQGGAVIAALPDTVRPEVVRRLATLESVTAEVVSDVAAGLEELFADHERGATPAAGPALAAELIAQLRKAQGDEVLDALEAADGTIAEEIRRQLFTFEHLSSLDDKGMRRLLQQVPMEDLALALKASSDSLRERVHACLSTRARESLADESESLGPRRLSEVEAKQREVVDVARRLADQGEIVLGSDSDEPWV
ncbi:MAG: flagellar motor switch protein FliG [Deltaproteobacteria bacterium]|nr:flagellar motor switch protein FliG [Deltaproteobacteria bacterium]